MPTTPLPPIFCHFGGLGQACQWSVTWSPEKKAEVTTCLYRSSVSEGRVPPDPRSTGSPSPGTELTAGSWETPRVCTQEAGGVGGPQLHHCGSQWAPWVSAGAGRVSRTTPGAERKAVCAEDPSSEYRDVSPAATYKTWWEPGVDESSLWQPLRFASASFNREPPGRTLSRDPARVLAPTSSWSLESSVDLSITCCAKRPDLQLWEALWKHACISEKCDLEIFWGTQRPVSYCFGSLKSTMSLSEDTPSPRNWPEYVAQQWKLCTAVYHFNWWYYRRKMCFHLSRCRKIYLINLISIQILKACFQTNTSMNFMFINYVFEKRRKSQQSRSRRWNGTSGVFKYKKHNKAPSCHRFRHIIPVFLAL